MTQAKWWNPPDDQSHLGCFSSGLASQAVCAVPHRREKTPLPEVAKNQDPARAKCGTSTRQQQQNSNNNKCCCTFIDTSKSMMSESAQWQKEKMTTPCGW